MHNNCSGIFAVGIKEVTPFELKTQDSTIGCIWYITKLQQQITAADDYDDEPTDLLCALPIEVLHMNHDNKIMIIGYLESVLYLRSLSLTNRILWEACRYYVKNGNMVEVTWKHHENGWKESLKVCSYLTDKYCILWLIVGYRKGGQHMHGPGLAPYTV